ALRKNLLDVPNARSSHEVPMPRGGGLAIVCAATVGFMLLSLSGVITNELLLILLTGGGAVALVGYMDDRRSLPAGLRLLIHLLSAVFAIWLLGGVPPVQMGDVAVDFGRIGDGLEVLAIVWFLNLFNFMDGIDVIAAS